MAELRIIGALAALATVSSTLLIIPYSKQGAQAQTQGMERRGERRGTRHDARAAKHACNSAEGKSRADCRQTKRAVKQSGRHEAPKPTIN
jgi:hypothetical protein